MIDTLIDIANRLFGDRLIDLLNIYWLEAAWWLGAALPLLAATTSPPPVAVQSQPQEAPR